MKYFIIKICKVYIDLYKNLALLVVLYVFNIKIVLQDNTINFYATSDLNANFYLCVIFNCFISYR